MQFKTPDPFSSYKTVKPVGLVFPDLPTRQKFTEPYGENLLEYAYRYDEIIHK
jgi:hypothetical protein